MKNTIKILSIIFLAIVLISFVSTNVFAWNAGGTISGLSNSAEHASVNDATLIAKAANIMALIRNIAVIAAVIIVMVLGIKYMLGSVEEKAEYKKSFMPLIIGIVLVVAATAIATFLFSIAA